MPKHAKPECPGFAWIGQPFSCCDRCGEPYWEHEFDTTIKRDKGPFDPDPFDYVPITDAARVAVCRKWGTDEQIAALNAHILAKQEAEHV